MYASARRQPSPQALIGSQRRTANLMMKNLDERYRDFVKARPSAAKRVPQYLIAGFLGVTPPRRLRVCADARRGLGRAGAYEARHQTIGV